MFCAIFRWPGRPPPEGAGQPDEVAHDTYFRVRRRDGDEAAVFMRSILAARLIFLEEVMEQAVHIDHADLELIDRGFAELLNCLFPGRQRIFPHVTIWHSPNETCSAMGRWVHGHLVFAALSQGLTFSFRSMGEAFSLGRMEEVRKWADLSIQLLDVSGAAFVLTGDFPPGEYENTIRPSMTAPNTPICLSGLMSADHRFMAQTIRDMRPVLKGLAEQEAERHERIAQATSKVYDRHIFVCERFVGARPSLLTAGRTERTGPSLIDQFRTLRLKPFEHSPRPQCQTRSAPLLQPVNVRSSTKQRKQPMKATAFKRYPKRSLNKMKLDPYSPTLNGSESSAVSGGIAIVGVSGRYPGGANSPELFWKNCATASMR